MQGALKRLVSKYGDDARLYHYEEISSGSYGSGYSLATADGVPISVIPDTSNATSGLDQLFGAAVDVDIEFLTDASHDVDGGGGEGATRVGHEGQLYLVLRANRSLSGTHGLQVLECERDSETTDIDYPATED